MAGLKIALVCDWFPPRVGGVERQVWGLAEALAARGHDTHVYTTEPGDAGPPGVSVHRLAMRRMMNVAMPIPHYFTIGHDILSCGQFDVVHAHGLFSGAGLGMVWLAGRLGVPTVVTAHSLAKGPTRMAARLLAGIFLKRVSRVSGVSRAVADDARDTLGRDDVVVVHNGINVSDWTAGCADRVATQMAAVTRLVPKKNPLGLVRAAGRILPRVSADATLTIIGSGPERARLDREIARLAIGGRVTVRAADDPRAIRDLLARSSIFLSTCPAEAFGIAALEARAMGVPVVALEGGGIREVVEHRRTGLLARNEAELAEHAVSLLGDEDARSRMAAASRAGLEHFDWSIVADEYLALYEDAIARTGRARGMRLAS